MPWLWDLVLAWACTGLSCKLVYITLHRAPVPRSYVPHRLLFVFPAHLPPRPLRCAPRGVYAIRGWLTMLTDTTVGAASSWAWEMCWWSAESLGAGAVPSVHQQRKSHAVSWGRRACGAAGSWPCSQGGSLSHEVGFPATQTVLVYFHHEDSYLKWTQWVLI